MTLSRLVSPPRAQWWRWWACRKRVLSQPGNCSSGRGSEARGGGRRRCSEGGGDVAGFAADGEWLPVAFGGVDGGGVVGEAAGGLGGDGGAVFGIADPGQQPHLRGGQLPARERLLDQRQFGQAAGDADVLARLVPRQAAAPR